jgi:hypothetical protein
MTSTDPSGQSRYRPRASSVYARGSLLGDGGRLMLLAVGGFILVRIALALLQHI